MEQIPARFLARNRIQIRRGTRARMAVNLRESREDTNRVHQSQAPTECHRQTFWTFCILFGLGATDF
ncbi:hypothetical protein SBA4_4980006 [Candidatus Sulfopaludibacter sp. SbA4]|nr:hypothetical protein SBA4_4980006 [Candidatus Sulfopaludibacter sp. SbA4]